MDQLRILDYKYIRFLFHPLQDKFVLSNNWKDNRWKDLSSVRLGIDGDEKDARELIFSKNMIEIKQKPIFHLLIDEVCQYNFHREQKLTAQGSPSVLCFSNRELDALEHR